jgi:hypothetical protein
VTQVCREETSGSRGTVGVFRRWPMGDQGDRRLIISSDSLVTRKTTMNLLLLCTVAFALKAQTFNGVQVGGTLSRPTIVNQSSKPVIGYAVQITTTTGINPVISDVDFDSIAAIEAESRACGGSPQGGNVPSARRTAFNSLLTGSPTTLPRPPVRNAGNDFNGRSSPGSIGFPAATPS